MKKKKKIIKIDMNRNRKNKKRCEKLKLSD